MDEDAVYQASALALAMVTGGVLVAIYESYAVKTNRLPTVTEIIKKGGWPARIGFVVVASAAAFDHFITGWVL